MSSALNSEMISGDCPAPCRDNLGMAKRNQIRAVRADWKESGHRLKLYRKAIGLSQETFAEEFADEFARSADSIGQYERGEAEVPPALIRAIRSRRRVDLAEWIYNGTTDLLSKRLHDEMMAKDKKAGRLQEPDDD